MEATAQKDIFSKFNFFTVPALTDEERRPPEFIVDGMIPVGLSFLSGAPKTRKSFLALQLAIAVATGNQFLGHATKRSDVVYLDLEGSKSRISARTARMTTAIPSNVLVTNSAPRKLADGLVDDLRQLHRQKPTIRLVIIDTFSRARGNPKSGNSNAYDADTAFLEPIQRMAQEEKIAILFVHHDKKGAGFCTDSFERLSGTMAISGSCDAVLNLISEGARFDGRAVLEFTPRDAKGGKLSLLFDDIFLEWRTTAPPDLRGNPIISWILQNVPDRGCEGVFIPYQDLVYGAYGVLSTNAGDKVLEAIRPHRAELFSDFDVGVQLGVKSHGRRGLRIVNLA